MRAHAIENGALLVFVCGGDGTVTACVTALAGTDVALAVLPAGTGNLLAANLPGRIDPAWHSGLLATLRLDASEVADTDPS